MNKVTPKNEFEKRVELIIMRHGEKARGTGIPSDPPLTRIGQEQTINFGKTQRERLSTAPVIVFASPLLRTLESAANVIEGLGRPEIQINVEEGLIEWLEGNGDIPMIFPRKQEMIPQDLVRRIDVNYHSRVRMTPEQLYQESASQLRQRTETVLRELISESSERLKTLSLPTTTKITAIIVTHAAVTVNALRFLVDPHGLPGVGWIAPKSFDVSWVPCDLASATHVVWNEESNAMVVVGELGGTSHWTGSSRGTLFGFASSVSANLSTFFESWTSQPPPK